MAAHNLKPFLVLFSIFFSTCFIRTFCTSPSSSPSTLSNSHLSFIKDLCKSTPYPDVCFDSLNISVSIDISPNILTYVLNSLQTALSEAEKLSNIFHNVAGNSNIVEKQKGTIQDCQELQQITVSSLEKSVSQISSATNSRKLTDATVFLSAALTNKNTCLEGLDSASGPSKPPLMNSISDAYKYVSNALSILSEKGGPNGLIHRRLMGFPSWMSRKDRQILQSSDDKDDYYDLSDALTVAADGTGNFTSLTDAINFAPNNSADRIFIFVRQGMYQENVEIPRWKTNIVLLGDGSDVTIIIGNRSVGDGWTTFRSATIAVSGEGFLAQDITIENTAGPKKGQAVALRVNADLAAVYKCSIKGFQDTLYVHSFRQFYRECDIYGTIDYIFGNAAVVLQKCNIASRLPIHGQSTVITAQSRSTEDEFTGISLQNCAILPTFELYSNLATVKSYLGRPWQNYSTTVVIESYIGEHIAAEGWTEWSGDRGLSTLYYGEYANDGPGAGTDNRVDWPGFHIMDYDVASEFSVSEFIDGAEWLDSTNFPYDSGI
ncbi:hypothetical protein ACH5RR_003927 [Cinchona calisaya]|uniref:Pectinesterase n=1 Tax=Cinchona calisaya TaxID=153742 RepID=A0ABD3AW81_9GENT